MKKVFALFSILITLTAIGQTKGQNKRPPIDTAAKKMCDSAVYYNSLPGEANTLKAISFFEKATQIDSNYYLAYWNKLTLELQLKNYQQAINTAKQLIRITPNVPESHARVGVLYDKIGDSVSSKRYYLKSLELCNQILDTLQPSKGKESKYEQIVLNKATVLIMLGEEKKGNLILENLLKTTTSELMKQEIQLVMNRRKEDLLNNFDKR